MRVERDGEVRSGRTIDLSGWDLPADVVYRGIRGDDVAGVTIACPEPSPVHDHVGLIERGMALRPKVALAAAARSRGLSTPEDDERRAIEAELAERSVPGVDLADARRRVAETEDEVTRLRERVATLQGRVRALREADLDAADAEAELATATRRLSEVETEHVAATQRLDGAREQARNARDRREERLALEDRAANLARAARRRLVADLHEEFADAVGVVPGPGSAGEEPGSYDGPTETAALAIARLADLDAPVVLDCRRFACAEAAADCLDVPVIRL